MLTTDIESPATTKAVKTSSKAPSRERNDISLTVGSPRDFIALNDDNGFSDGSSLGTPPPIPNPDYYDQNSFHPYRMSQYGPAMQPYGHHAFSIPISLPPYIHQPNEQSSRGIATSPGYGMTWNQAEQAIGSFSTKFAPEFAFLDVGQDMPPEQLYCENTRIFSTCHHVGRRLCGGGIYPESNEKGFRTDIKQRQIMLRVPKLGSNRGTSIFNACKRSFHMDIRIIHPIRQVMGFVHKLEITRMTPTL
ncbi:hypothetical protein SCAR479_00958 [Seiridium cardinale]|uniref:Uncharacterized protein n=1 Tax=Seiridium cardinale TaxID=138064 RepID=A0ABR2Y7P6_9PEZI